MTKKTKPEKPVFEFGSVEKVHDELLAASPEPQASAIAARADQEREKLTATGQQTDKAGTIFDAAIHAVNKDGEPSVTPTGKFRKKRGSVVATQSETAKTVQDENAARAAGVLAADMLMGSAVTLLGPEWIPLGPEGEQEPMQYDERSNIRNAMATYFVAKGITDFPPGIMLTVALSSYASARIVGGPETKTKLAKTKDWISNAWLKLYYKVKKNAPHDNTRDNGVREKHAGKEPMPEGEKSGERDTST